MPIPSGFLAILEVLRWSRWGTRTTCSGAAEDASTIATMILHSLTHLVAHVLSLLLLLRREDIFNFVLGLLAQLLGLLFALIWSQRRVASQSFHLLLLILQNGLNLQLLLVA